MDMIKLKSPRDEDGEPRILKTDDSRVASRKKAIRFFYKEQFNWEGKL